MSPGRPCLLLSPLLALLACASDPCPSGGQRFGATCRKLDRDGSAGEILDGGEDAGLTPDMTDSGAPPVPDDCSPPCTASAPNCSPSGTCGACVGSSDCAPFAATPVCASDGTCAACTAEDNSSCTAQGKLCLVAATPSENTCVECLENAHCPATAPICGSDHACRACEVSDSCDDGRVCETEPGPFAGQCVECSKDHLQNCTIQSVQFVCNHAERTCDFTRRARSKTSCAVCISPGDTSCNPLPNCVSDLECQVGQACIRHELGAGEAVCVIASPPFTPLNCTRPFRIDPGKLAQTTIEGSPVNACTLMPAKTCRALLDHTERKRCGLQPAANPAQDVQAAGGSDDLCGAAGLDDGVCVWRATSAQYVCTIECLQPVDDDCPTGETCSVGAPAVCVY